MSSWEVFAPTVAVAGHWYLLTGNESEVKVEGGRLYDAAQKMRWRVISGGR